LFSGSSITIFSSVTSFDLDLGFVCDCDFFSSVDVGVGVVGAFFSAVIFDTFIIARPSVRSCGSLYSNSK